MEHAPANARERAGAVGVDREVAPSAFVEQHVPPPPAEQTEPFEDGILVFAVALGEGRRADEPGAVVHARHFDGGIEVLAASFEDPRVRRGFGGPPGTPLGEPGDGASGFRVGAALSQHVFYQGGGDGAHLDEAAPRAHRGQQRGGLLREQNQVDVVRWLFQRLEQAVRRLAGSSAPRRR